MSSLSLTLVLFIDDELVAGELFKYGECVIVFTQIGRNKVVAFSERTGKILGRGTINWN
ncbi:hypothetical protein [Thermococcus sp.]|uniref:hypothetical protein n=1 Tax=Thermococcus sp. TaxID=35749 RepID=UPI00262C5C31|nr:hypothetical protein [Thermococcus sp.]